MGIDANRIGTVDGTVYELENPTNSLPFKMLFNNGGWVPEIGEIIGKTAYTYELGEMDDETGQGNPCAYYSYGALGMEVAVNVETGAIKVLKAVGYYDAGRILNPKTIEGQMDGAFVMGIGQAIFEEMMFNEKGNIINPNYRDYKIPTMLDVPYNKDMFGGFVGKPNEEGPYGAKGIGEVALVPVMPAIANAITDALGVELNQIPMTKERVMWSIKKQ
jgi:CO/xanthine dehydrogenase Mo-binding subunit